jgi:hypothetical protein
MHNGTAHIKILAFAFFLFFYDLIKSSVPWTEFKFSDPIFMRFTASRIGITAWRNGKIGSRIND